ncbi:MAG: hypothetical protein IPM38_17295 [Ignavibacteria bacterium]|nr:hypothetical protein [Ignavibacteria bacterium]
MNLKTLNIFLSSILIVIAFAGDVKPQYQLKIMTYNLLNYPNTDTNIRNPHFRTIINAADPDILVVNEINTQTGVNDFLKNVLNFSGVVYSSGTYINGPDSDNAIYFKTVKVNFISNVRIATLLRDINEFKITDKIYNDTLRIYAVHLRAGDTSIVRRGAETDSLRKRTNALPAGTDFIVLGDFNIYSANEPAYIKLLFNDPNNDGNFYDNLNLTGTWNNFAYRFYHTQSTRTRSFGDGATGGLDDRFDMILYSGAVKNPGGIKFIPGSYVNYGNDGNHFNDSINKSPNNAVGQTIANALHYASDHLPVFALFEFGSETVLNLKIIPQGLYNLSLNKLNIKDTIKVFLSQSFSPYLRIDSAVSVIDSVSFISGLKFRNAPAGNYYLEAVHRNTINTWSGAGGIQYKIDSLMSYDFTDNISKAFGNNMIQLGTKFCIYSGDVNKDNVIDIADMGIGENSAAIFLQGYAVTDVNGDLITDLNDLSIIENNAVNLITVISP